MDFFLVKFFTMIFTFVKLSKERQPNIFLKFLHPCRFLI